MNAAPVGGRSATSNPAAAPHVLPARTRRDLVRLAAPLVVARAAPMLLGLCSIVALGRYASRELAVFAVVSAWSGFAVQVGSGLLLGAPLLVARAAGAGELAAAGAVWRRGLRYGVVIATAGALVVMVGARLSALGSHADAAILPIAAVAALALWPGLAGVTTAALFEGLQRPAVPMVATLVGVLVNLALLVVLVSGGVGLRSMGALGAVIADLVSRTAILLVLLARLARKDLRGALGLHRSREKDRAAWALQRRLGYGAALTQGLAAAAFTAATLLAARLGPEPLAAYAVVGNVQGLVFVVPAGLAAATAVRCASAWGRGDASGARREGGLGLAAAVAIGALAAVVILAMRSAIAHAYSTDAVVVVAAVQLLALMALSLPADAGQTVLSAALRARGDIWFPTAIYAGAYLLVMIVGGWALAFPAGLGVRGLVVATLIGCVCGASGLGARWAWLARQDAHEIRSCD